MSSATSPAAAPSADEALLEVRGLRLSGPLAGASGSRAMLVDSVSLRLRAGETLALVGESGSGKTLTALAVLGLLPPGVRVEAGALWFDGRDLLNLRARALRKLRGRGMAMVFQEASSALDPLLDVGRQIGDALRRHGGQDQVRQRTLELLRSLDFEHPERVARARPHELSGGMAQRALLALALACEPKLLICDEPTRALDAPTATLVLDVLLRARSPGRSQLVISHDLDAVRRVADRIAVMHAGQIVEFLDLGEGAADLESQARHPYTRALLAARPGGEPGAPLSTLVGDAPRPGAFPAGCRFAPRCPHAHARCETEAPGWFGASGALDACAAHAERLDGAQRRWRCFGWSHEEGSAGRGEVTDD